MKKIFIFICVMLISLVGCSKLGDEKQNIVVQNYTTYEKKYVEVKKITNDNDIKKIKEILENIDWENAKVDMVRTADYKFELRYENPNVKSAPLFYELWISPNKDKVELVSDESKYVQLDKNKSAELFYLLTGIKLSDIN